MSKSNATETAVLSYIFTATAPSWAAATELDIHATGALEAEIAPFSTLSPESLAASVWSSVATDNANVGTMGEALNFAYVMLRNKIVTDPSAGTITVYDTDGTTVLYSADLFQDAAGLTAYAGAGAERRERME